MSRVWRTAWLDIWRDLRDTELKLLALSVLLGVTALSAVAMLSDRLQSGMQRDAARILGGDVVVVSDRPPPDIFSSQARALGLQSAVSLSFPTMARTAEGNARLVALKAAHVGYPLRGQLQISRHDDLSQTEPTRGLPEPGQVWIEPALAQVLELKLGDEILVSQLRLRVSALLISEPDRGAGFMNFAPRLFMHPDDVTRSELIQPASRVTWRLALTGPTEPAKAYARWAMQHTQRPDVRGLRIETLESGRPEMKQTLDRAGQFIRLVALMAGFLCAVAVALSARAFALRRVSSVALLRVLGQSQRQIVIRFGAELLGVGLLASLAGLLAGYGLHLVFVELLAGLVETRLPEPGAAPVWLGLGVGMTLLAAFGLPPILRLSRVPALRVIRHDWGPPKGGTLLVWGVGMLGFMALMLQVSQSIQLGLLVLGGFAAALVMFSGLSWVALRLLRASVNERTAPVWLGLATRQMAARPGLVMLQVSAMAVGLMALMLLLLLRTDLLQAWRQASPADAPNRFVINIQPDQSDDLQQELRRAGVGRYDWFPMIRGRLVEVNGEPVKPDQYSDERAKRLVDREFNLSYSAVMPLHNQIVAGAWQAEQADGLSLEQGIARTLGLKLGDQLLFDMGGVAVAGRVTSIRRVDWSSMRANFFVLFPRSAMPEVPASFMTAYRSPTGVGLDHRLLKLYPNITQVNLTDSLNQVQAVLLQVGRAIEFMFLFALGSGLMVLVTVVTLTREERLRDHAVLRALGASKQLLSRLQSAEMLGTGALAGGLASLTALAMAWLLAHEIFEFDWRLPWWALPLGTVLGAGIAAAVGGLTLRGVLRQSVTQTLRQAPV